MTDRKTKDTTSTAALKPAKQTKAPVSDKAVATAADIAAAECVESIRTVARKLRRRIDAVMAATGKRPGDLESFILELNAMIGTESPLLDYTVEDSADVEA